jgi:hypothetical protein
MKTTKIKKLYQFELERLYKQHFDLGVNGTLDYRLRNFFEELCDDGLYKYDYSKRESKLRITFPLFILVILLTMIYSCFKWLFTGSIRLDNKSWFTRQMVKWDKYCGFNIIS